MEVVVRSGCSAKRRLVKDTGRDRDRDAVADARRQISQGPQLQATDKTTANFDLIPELPNEITLGPLMACMRWYMKPLLTTLSRTWADALHNPQFSTPQYQPNALKKSVILYANTPTIGYDNNLALRIYQDGLLRRVPLPPDSAVGFVRFFVTDQCIYALTPHSANQEYMYIINMLDLGGGMFKWQTLPPLPYMGECISISSIISEDGNSIHDYIWMRANGIGIEEDIYLKTGQRFIMADSDDWCAWKLHTTTRDGQCQSIPPHLTPARPVKKIENHPPEYLDIYTMDKLRPRHLYKLFTVYEYSLELNHENIIQSTAEPGFLLVFKDDHAKSVITGVHCIRKKVNIDESVKLLLYKKDLKKAQALEGKELIEAFKSWRNFLSNWRLYLPEQISAVKFTADLSQRMDGWQKQWSLPSSKRDGYVLHEQSTIKLAQEGTMYVYAYIATICTNMYLQGGPNTNILASQLPD